ncbi:MAG: tetratricopeptide repeat protein, partial [Saprospiraceae bacterium]
MKRTCWLFHSTFAVWLLPTALWSFLSLALCAQDPNLVPEFEKELREATTDSARAIALQDLAFNLAHSEPARSMAYAEQALRVAERTGDAGVLSECQNGVGWAYFSQGNFARARLLLDSSIQYMRATKNYFDLVSVCNNQGWVCLKQGDNLGALRYFREGLNAAEISGDQRRIAFMNRSMGAFYNAQKEYDKSIPHIQRATEMFEAMGDSMQMSDCLSSLANAHSGLGQQEIAITYYKKALPIAHAMGDLLEEGMIYENWGMALGQLKRFDEAFSKLQTARRLIEPLNERIEMASLHHAIGSMYLMKGDTAQAIASLEMARRLSADLQQTDVLSEVLPALYESYAATGSH